MFLKPYPAETTKEGDSSKSENAAEPMEVAPVDVVNSCLTKRKAEFEPEPEEEEMSSDEVEEVKIEDPGRILRAPESDVDSFDGLEYYSSPEIELEEPLPDEEEAMANYKITKRQLIESKGFYIEPGRRIFYLFKGIKPMSLDREALGKKTFREYWAEMVLVSLQKYNKDKERNVEFVEVVRGNYRGGARAKSYITFMAREEPDGPLVEYQTKCMVTLDGKTHPIFCRQAPTPKP